MRTSGKSKQDIFRLKWKQRWLLFFSQLWKFTLFLGIVLKKYQLSSIVDAKCTCVGIANVIFKKFFFIFSHFFEADPLIWCFNILNREYDCTIERQNRAFKRTTIIWLNDYSIKFLVWLFAAQKKNNCMLILLKDFLLFLFLFSQFFFFLNKL